MTPTREQIKAAEKAYDATFIRGTHSSALAAALTAGAQVDNMSHITKDDLVLAAKISRENTIERCAQVVENDNFTHPDKRRLAAAIRAMKE